VTLDLLERAQASRERLRGGDDPEGLHDFRVAVRRLRSAQRTFATELGAAGDKRSRRRWSEIASATGPGRDAEAQREWLAAAQARLSPPARRAARSLIAELGEELEKEQSELAAAARRFDRAATRLRDELASYTVRLDAPPDQETFGVLAGRRVRELGDDLAERLAAVGGARDVDGAHEARIAGKRLRYGLEIAAPDARRPLARLKTLQDLLGELHDVHGLMKRVARIAGREARDRARRLAELAAEKGIASDQFRSERRRGAVPWWSLLDGLRQRQDELYGVLRKDWLADAAAPAIALLLTESLATRPQSSRLRAL
jgi:CHAD domain-containing protein